VIDWTTVSSLATGLGTLVLAVATFAAVRSANRAARAAERSLLAGLRPLLVPSRLEDGQQKVFFGDGKHVMIPGGEAAQAAVKGRDPLTIDLMYGDYEGGQRVISRFLLRPAGQDRWLASVTRHWNVDRPEPR
jgi:hypothetical protein